MLAPCFFCTTCSSLAHHPALTSDAAYRRRQIEAVTAYDYTCGVFRIRAANTGPDSHTSDLFHFTVAVNALDVSLEGTFCFARSVSHGLFRMPQQRIVSSGVIETKYEETIWP
jgi:hypothetical protein